MGKQSIARARTGIRFPPGADLACSEGVDDQALVGHDPYGQDSGGQDSGGKDPGSKEPVGNGGLVKDHVAERIVDLMDFSALARSQLCGAPAITLAIRYGCVATLTAMLRRRVPLPESADLLTGPVGCAIAANERYPSDLPLLLCSVLSAQGLHLTPLLHVVAEFVCGPWKNAALF